MLGYQRVQQERSMVIVPAGWQTLVMKENNGNICDQEEKVWKVLNWFIILVIFGSR
jgi:hypothetical protein